VLASTLGCREDQISRGARIKETEGWDSLNHVQLMLALEEEFCVRLHAETILQLTTLDRIVSHFREAPPAEAAGPTRSPEEPAAGTSPAAMDLDEFAAAFKAALHKLGIEPDDLLLVHSFLGTLLPAFSRPDAVCEKIIEVLRETIGPQGTLVLPTFTRTFTHKGTVDRDHTPSEMGVLTEYFRTLPGVRHTLHPFHRFSALGAHADELVRSDCPSSFGPGSPLHVMHRLGGKTLLFSVDWEICTFFHYVEDYESVSGTVVTPDGPRQETWQMYAGNLGHGCEDSFNAFGRRVEAAGLCNSTWVGPVRLRSFRMDKLFDFTYAALEQETDCLIVT
jgi:aminoglycoside 3-N-acetyltransferase